MTGRVFEDNLKFLAEEFEYLDLEAVNAPKIEDFSRLNAARKRARKTRGDVRLCIDRLTELKKEMRDTDAESWKSVLRSAQNSILQEPEQILNRLWDMLPEFDDLKREFDDTLQLLVGSISIVDAAVQRGLVEDSRIQARRSTALTALAAVYLPLTLATGIFGMNIREINDGTPKWWIVLAVAGGILLPSAVFMGVVISGKRTRGGEIESRMKAGDSHQTEKEFAQGYLRSRSPGFREKMPFFKRKKSEGNILTMPLQDGGALWYGKPAMQMRRDAGTQMSNR